MAIYSNQNFRVEYSKRDPAKIHVNIFYKMSETSYQYRLEWDRNDNESESESDSWETRVDLVSITIKKFNMQANFNSKVSLNQYFTLFNRCFQR